MTRKGIDISTYQKNVDYAKLKEQGIQFAIIRCGYGKELTQKDAMFETHYRGLKEQGIKVGAYLYSYCKTVEDSFKEAENCLNFIKGKEFELPIFYDLEDKVTQNCGRVEITQMAINFCETIEKAGYKVGIYANLYWFNNLIDITKVDKYFIWLAQWNNAHTANFRVDLWQFTNQGQILGINGNVDMDIDYNCLTDDNLETKKTNEQIAEEVIKGLWGNQPERQQLLEQAGYNYEEIQAIVNQKMLTKKTNEQIAEEVIKGLWGNQPERQQLLEQAGYNYKEIQAIVNQKMKK